MTHPALDQRSPCPCCSKKKYGQCCLPYVDGQAAAPTALSLMRSRYTAFCLGKLDYLRATWHPETLPDLNQDEPSQWVGLEIVDAPQDEEEDEPEAEVEFIAKLINGDQLEVLHEISDLIKVDGQWLYHSGEFLNEDAMPKKIPMQSPCPCGSGTPFKHCHFRK